MANRKPLVVASGAIKELPAGDSLIAPIIGASAATTTSAGGAATITGGPGGGTSGDGGAVTLTGGIPIDGKGGAINLVGKNGVGTNRAGGQLNLTAGDSTGTASGGAIEIQGGNNPTNSFGGAVSLYGGSGTSGYGGVNLQGDVINLKSGNGTSKVQFQLAGGWNIAGAGVGTSGQVLTSAGNAPPTWQTPTAYASVAYVDAGDALKANLASPTFTGVPAVPTASGGTNTTQAASTAYVRGEIASLIASSPSTLDTLNELALALGSDPNFATTMTTALALKAPLASPALTGNPTAPTASPGDNDTSIATTAFVTAAVAAGGGGAAAAGTLTGTTLASNVTSAPGLILLPSQMSPFVGPMRNALINGNFEAWQRGTSFAGLGAAAQAYTADRWAIGSSGAQRLIVGQSFDVPTVAQAGTVIPNSLSVSCTTTNVSPATGNYCTLTHNIEGFVWRKLWQRALVLSFWVNASQTGTFSVALESGGANRSYIGQYTVNAANTWEFKTITFTASPSSGTWPLTTGIGAFLYFGLCLGATFQSTAGSWLTGNFVGVSGNVNVMSSTSNTWMIANVQLEVGSAPSEFEDVPFDLNLLRCRRYYEKSFPYATVPVQNCGSHLGAHSAVQTKTSSTASQASGLIPFKLAKRAVPTVVTFSPAAGSAQFYDFTSSTAATSLVVVNTSEHGFSCTYTTASSSANGDNNTLHWTADAEL